MAEQVKLGASTKLAEFPSGDARREEEKRRADEFAQKTEEASSSLEVAAANSAALEVESELAQYFDELDVSNQDPNYHYSWVNGSPMFYGRFIQKKLAQRWELVSGNMNEAQELRTADGTRRLGDVVLMRIRKEYKARIDAAAEEKRKRARLGIYANFLETARKGEKYGASVHIMDNMDPALFEKMSRNAQAKSRAGRTMDGWMRQGRMPGVTL